MMADPKKTENVTSGEKSSTEHTSLKDDAPKELPKDEVGGRKEGLEPTRYNDWEQKGRCIDF